MAPPDSTYYAGFSEAQQREATALGGRDLLGNVPGAGSLGLDMWRDLIAMMVIVGPVDWLVLKKLGRHLDVGDDDRVDRPGDAVGGVCGASVQSGELHFRTFHWWNQVDGKAGRGRTLRRCIAADEQV